VVDRARGLDRELLARDRAQQRAVVNGASRVYEVSRSIRPAGLSDLREVGRPPARVGLGRERASEAVDQVFEDRIAREMFVSRRR
jgi:hypothetical protein